MFVITDPSAEYFIPSNATVTVAQAGDECDIIGVNDGTAQTADSAGTTTEMLIIQDVGTKISGGAATDVIVKISPLKFQAD
jgi:hypothetical protein